MTDPIILISILLCGFAGPADADDPPEAKALRFLSAEVPGWSAEHKCFSCHNNGDAARALHLAIRLGRTVPEAATRDTDRWLAGPEGWGKNGGDGPFVDKVLARIQFTAALNSALASGRIADRKPLEAAARKLAEDQAEDGSFRVDVSEQVGSPATYGRALATWMAVDSLRAADPDRYRSRIKLARSYLGSIRPLNTPDAAARLLALADDPSETTSRPALDYFRNAQRVDGGWGPYASSGPEAFDTALALLALDGYRESPGVARQLELGRKYLVSIQQDDGSWTETTRPGGNESYAQRLSTTGWATLALLTVKGK